MTTPQFAKHLSLVVIGAVLLTPAFAQSDIRVESGSGITAQSPLPTVTPTVSLPSSATTAPTINNEKGTGNTEEQSNAAESAARRESEKQIAEELRKSEPPTEFQTFIQSLTGQPLPIFGSKFFASAPSTFTAVDRVPASAEYIIGPGDQLVINGWGALDINYRATVDRTGNIYIPKVGSVAVSGVRFGDIEQHLRRAIEKNYHGFEISVTLGQIRSIQVFVIGNARRPGTYTISAFSGLVNALFASGGPSNRGSMRRIQVKRGGKLVTDFDFYDLLLHGDKSKDAMLQAGDVIFIPPIGEVAAIMGSVNEPSIYELKPGSTLDDLIGYAGGLTPNADGLTVTVERIADRSVRRVEEFALNNEGLKRVLQSGDLVTVRSISGRYDNAITIRGNVENPGRYPYRPGMRVKDVIPSRNFLLTRTFWATQLALTQQEVQASKEGKARLGEPQQPEASRQQSDSKGAVKLSNEIKRSAPEINWDYAVVQRLNGVTLSTTLLPFNLGEAIEGNEKENLALEPGDVITIFSQADLQVPIAKQKKFVRLEGEFQPAGVYEVRPGETLRELVNRVGGLSGSAYLFGAEFTRESTRAVQQKRWDEFLQKLEEDVERASSSRSSNAVSPEDALSLRERAESQRRLVEKLRQVHPTGRIVLGVKPWENSAEALPDVVLEDGDRLFVPYRPAMVNVIGAVYNDASFLYESNRSFGYYLRKAGGGTRSADRRNSFVVRADGSIVSRSHASSWFVGDFGGAPIMPGDTIIVPEKLDKVGVLKGLKDWSQVIAQFALGVAAVHTLTQ